MSSSVIRRSPARGRYFDETTDANFARRASAVMTEAAEAARRMSAFGTLPGQVPEPPPVESEATPPRKGSEAAPGARRDSQAKPAARRDSELASRRGSEVTAAAAAEAATAPEAPDARRDSEAAPAVRRASAMTSPDRKGSVASTAGRRPSESALPPGRKDSAATTATAATTAAAGAASEDAGGPRRLSEALSSARKGSEAPVPEERPVAAGVDEANYRLLIGQLVLCNEEIERLQRLEDELFAENETLRQELVGLGRLPPVPAAMPSPPRLEVELESSAEPSVPAIPNASLDYDPLGELAAPPASKGLDVSSDGGADISPAVLRPYLGVEVIDTGSEVVVRDILSGGGADDAGLQVNDVLVKWNGQPINSRPDFGMLVSQAEVGTMVKLLVERGPRHESKELRVEVKGTMGPAKSSTPKPNAKRSRSASSRAGP